ncbi:MAG: phosphoglycerate dehydrogenase [Elusimicrobia bacterium]|nr:phosphoglycerate dehydrogenase [Elusimicrobiota bacterium]
MSKAILITTSSFSASDPGPREELSRVGLEIHANPFGRKLTEAEILDLLGRHRPSGLIAGLEPLTARVLESAAAHLRVISRCGVGVDNVDQDAARRLGIRLFNTPEAPVEAVAELAVALILACLRRVPEADRAMRAGQWKQLQGSLLGAKTVGIVGCGRIGRRVAALVRAFGSRVLAHDPAAGATCDGVERVGLDELFAASDIVTLHLPFSEATRHLVGRGRLERMRRGAVLVNASRGGLVDEAALAEALKSGRLSAAALDVFETEPYSGALRELPNVVLTPHMGSAAVECRVRMEREAAVNLIGGLKECGVL